MATNSASDVPSLANVTFHDLERNPSPDIDLPHNNHRRWHPKISPYRLLVIITTVGFGTAKSLLARTGGTFISTTLEWVAGTLIVLLFFSISSYETPDNQPPKYLSWLFEPDCANALWFLLDRTLSLKRPAYSSEERSHDDVDYTNDNPSFHPALTHYRLLVVLTVTSFGLSKAELAYSGESAAMNWIDWALAVPITTIFYVLGLYEYNNSHLWPSFFVVDRKLGLSVGIQSSVGILFSIVWTVGSLFALHYNWHFVDWVSDRPDYTKAPAVSAARASVYLVSYHLMQLLSSALLLAHVLCGLMMLNYIINFFTTSMEMKGNLMIKGWKKTRRWARALVQNVAPLVRSLPFKFKVSLSIFPRANGYSGVLLAGGALAKRVGKNLVHILAHLAILALCFMMLGVLVGISVALSDMRSENRGFWNGVLFGIILLPISAAFLCYLTLIWVAVYSMLFSSKKGIMDLS